MSTSEIKKLEPGCSDDTQSFMLPCYSFKNANAGTAYVESETASRAALVHSNVIVESNQYIRFYQGGYYYVPRLSWLPIQREAARQNCWLTTQLLSNDLDRRKPKTIWKVLRSVTTPMPLSARNMMLLIEGRRRFRLPYQDSQNVPKWWQHLSTGERDCFAAWGKDDGSPRGAGMRGTSEPGQTNPTLLHAASRGRGVLYAKSTMFDYDGHPNGFRTEVILVQFNILAADPNKDDLVKIDISARVSYGDGTISHHNLDVGWRQLISRAQAGFEKYCLPVPPAVDQWRRFFIEQSAKADVERRKYIGFGFGYRPGPSFLRDIRTVTWRVALDLVREPWQLQLVMEEYCDSQFDETPNRYDPTATRVRRMLDAYSCTPERRAVLNKMIVDYVEPADNLWNYVGD